LEERSDSVPKRSVSRPKNSTKLFFLLFSLVAVKKNVSYTYAVSLDLGAVPIGAFRDSEVSCLLELSEEEQALYIIPIGHPAVD